MIWQCTIKKKMQKINQFHCSVESLFMEDNLNRQYDENKEKESCPEKFKIYPGVILFCWKQVFRLPAI